MSTRDRIALSVPPLLLRLMLAVIFLWAGLSKALTYMPVSPEGAATLSSMGVAVTNSPTPIIVPPGGTGGGAMLVPDLRPPLGITGAGFQAGGGGGGGAGSTNPPFPADGFSKPKDKDAKPETKPDQPATTPPAGEAPKSEPKNPFVPPAPTPPAATTPPAPTPTPAATPATTPSGPVRTAADFPNPEPVRRVYMLALGVHGAANPPALPAGPSGEPAGTKMRLLPGELGQGARPVYFAFTITAIEIISGAMLLLGMMSRLWALAIACVMIGAIWMTQIGPAMQSGDTFLGFLPNYPWGDPSKWNTFFLQLALLASALAVFFAGSGALAVDNALFGKRAGAADLDE